LIQIKHARKFERMTFRGRAKCKGEVSMMRLVALAGFALAVATSAQAMPRATLGQAGSLITQVRAGCGVGMVMMDGQCISRHIRAERGTGNDCYRGWDQDRRSYKSMPCASDSPAYVDTPGVHAILRARKSWGNGTWYSYARSSGITCMPGTMVTMGGQQHLCQ
jgi:hypothetical protein